MAQSIENQKDRSVHFWKFFAMFVLSTALIVLAVFFNYHLSDKETNYLRQEVDRYHLQEVSQKKFVDNMEVARRLIDSLSTPGANIDYLNQQIVEKIRQLNDIQYTDSSYYGSFNRTVMNVFLNYKDVSNKVVKYGSAPADLEKMKEKYDESQRYLEDCRNTLQTYRNMPPPSGL